MDSLHQQPEAALVYPGSTDVHINDHNGIPGNWIGKGGVAITGKTGTTTHTQIEVLAYFSEQPAGNGWTQTHENAKDTTPAGLPAHFIAWERQSLHRS